MTDMRYASLVGYEQAVISGLTSELQRQVMRCLFEADVPMTRRMIEVRTGIRISTITPAVWTLIQSGLIHVAYEGKDPHSGYLADFLEPAWPQPQQRSFDGFAHPTEYP